MPSLTDTVVVSKSLALLEKTKRRIEQIDSEAFPTPSSEIPRGLLLTALESLAQEKHWKVMAPATFYYQLIQLQTLVSKVESSHSDDISWPLVSYCDHFWNLLFPSTDATIFYSILDTHNYGISSFTSQLRTMLETLLPKTEVKRILGVKEVYCLQIASLETENLPLYANIGHEFGHALHQAKLNEISAIISDEIKALATVLAPYFRGASLAAPTRCARLISKIATELFCDLVGILVAGPASLLSLYEMVWEDDPNSWGLTLNSNESYIRLWGDAFRLSAIKQIGSLNSFGARLKVLLEGEYITSPDLVKMHGCVASIPEDHSSDKVSVSPTTDKDAAAIKLAFEFNLPQLKTAFLKMMDRFSKEILGGYFAKVEFARVSEDEIFQLLRRLEADILPNIIPDGTLLGKPASFSTILNACAIFRMHALETRKATEGSAEISKTLHKIDRLTAKALEVSYVQHDFNKWKKP